MAPNGNTNHVVIEIEEMLGRTKTANKTRWCIYRVPHDLRGANEDAYTPQVVSIGPFHYENERLKNMETHKLIYLKKFLKRTNTNLGELVSFIDNSEPSIRHCYAENIKFDKHTFIRIVLLYACFIIELFLRYHMRDWPEEDALSPETRISEIIDSDLLLLENQLPFFVLENLFNLAFPSRKSNQLPSFPELTFKYFHHFNKQLLDTNGVYICHLTGLLRYFYLQKPCVRPKRVKDTEALHFSASELHKAGLMFKGSNRSCLLELQFSGRLLEIPQLCVDDNTEKLFRNVMAFEQCHCPNDSHFTDYVIFFGFLINTSNDVNVLIENGIIAHLLDDSDAVAKLFNGLGKNIMQAGFNPGYIDICRNLNNFYRNPCHKLTATFKRDYCSTPWQGAASITAILLIFLTLIQTICSILQVMQQPKNA